MEVQENNNSKVEEKKNLLESFKRVVNQDVISFSYLLMRKCDRVFCDL
jgi:hypothetical protein